MSPRHPIAAVLALVAALALSGFTGNVGAESEFYVGLGIGQVNSAYDSDRYGEVAGSWRYKFRHHPYDDMAAWIGIGGGWTTYPTGGNFGNQVVTLQFMGGFTKNWGEFGGGLLLTGDTTGIGPMIVLPAFRLRLGPHDKIQFGFGVFDEAPFWSGGGAMHFELIASIPFEKLWAPRAKIGGRLNFYAPDERVPIELYGGVEARLGRHIRVGVEASLGDGGASFGGGDEPSFTLALKVGGAVGPGTRSEGKPQPPR